MGARFYSLILSLWTAGTFADVMLPFHSLRIQPQQDCGAYAMSSMLESRAIVRDSLDIDLDIERDLRYWINYDRMTYIATTKKEYQLDLSSIPLWQIEYWEAFLKHGKAMIRAAAGSRDLGYDAINGSKKALPYSLQTLPKPDPSLMSMAELKVRLKQGFASPADADTFIRDYLDRYYGKPTTVTAWENSQVSVEQIASLVLGGDFAQAKAVDAMVLAEPVDSGATGWHPEIYDRYWSYRIERAKILDLVRQSLDNNWPVTFDTPYHAMTILGYRSHWLYKHMYAIADSRQGRIYWRDESSVQTMIHLATFFNAAIPGTLPPRD